MGVGRPPCPGMRMRARPGETGAGGADVDDRPLAAAAQQRQGMLAEQEGAGQVGVQPALPVGQFEFLQGPGMRVADAGVADQGIEAAMPFLCALDNLAQARLVADIQRHGPGRGAQARGGLFAFGAIEVGQHHLPAVLHQALGDTEADPPRGAGDERDPRVALMGCVLSRGKSPVSLAAPRMERYAWRRGSCGFGLVREHVHDQADHRFLVLGVGFRHQQGQSCEAHIVDHGLAGWADEALIAMQEVEAALRLLPSETGCS